MHNSSFNYCNLPPWVIASRHFNDNPRELSIQGVKEANRFLFEKLASMPAQEERALVFNDFMSVKFQLHNWQDQATDTARKSIKNSYLRFLRGWMMDSNSVEGAVLKRWVESRMGIVPTFHRVRISGIHSEPYYEYSVDVVRGSARTNAIQSQLDLLYEYCQFELPRKYPGRTTIPLYRGTYDASEHDILEQVGKREQIVRLNNLVSFTSDEERAWEFGSTVWEVAVPLCKIVFYNDLLPGSIMKGEGEYLIIGGEYRVRQVPCTV
ncbi:MAG TPA: NAD(+)--dinitrogen-reductase ADP-D-ribosyltransferase [Desulfuromonadaceae bacterium]